MEDRLIGTADLEESMKTGRTLVSPSLLAMENRDSLHIDDVDLLDEEITNMLLNVVNDGYR